MSNPEIRVDDMVLMKNNKRIDRKGRKFSQKWLGPYTVTKISEKGVVTLKNTSGLILNKKYNVANLKHYFQEESGDTSSTAIRSSNFWSDAPDEIVVVFFLYLGFLSRTFMIHGTAGEQGGYLFNSSLPLPPASQTLRH